MRPYSTFNSTNALSKNYSRASRHGSSYCAGAVHFDAYTSQTCHLSGLISARTPATFSCLSLGPRALFTRRVSFCTSGRKSEFKHARQLYHNLPETTNERYTAAHGKLILNATYPFVAAAVSRMFPPGVSSPLHEAATSSIGNRSVCLKPMLGLRSICIPSFEVGFRRRNITIFFRSGFLSPNDLVCMYVSLFCWALTGPSVAAVSHAARAQPG